MRCVGFLTDTTCIEQVPFIKKLKTLCKKGPVLGVLYFKGAEVEDQVITLDLPEIRDQRGVQREGLVDPVFNIKTPVNR